MVSYLEKYPTPLTVRIINADVSDLDQWRWPRSPIQGPLFRNIGSRLDPACNQQGCKLGPKKRNYHLLKDYEYKLRTYAVY